MARGLPQWRGSNNSISAPKLSSYGDAFAPLAGIANRLSELEARKAEIADKQEFQSQREALMNQWAQDAAAKDRTFRSGEAEKGRKFQTSERLGSQTFRAGESELDRSLTQRNFDKNYNLAAKKFSYQKSRDYAKDTKDAKKEAALNVFYASQGKSNVPMRTVRDTDRPTFKGDPEAAKALLGDKEKDYEGQFSKIQKSISNVEKEIGSKLLGKFMENEDEAKKYVSSEIYKANNRLASGKVSGSVKKNLEKKVEKLLDANKSFEKYKKNAQALESLSKRFSSDVKKLPKIKTYEHKKEVVDIEPYRKQLSEELNQIATSPIASTPQGKALIGIKSKQIAEFDKGYYDTQIAAAKKEKSDSELAKSRMKMKADARADWAKSEELQNKYKTADDYARLVVSGG